MEYLWILLIFYLLMLFSNFLFFLFLLLDGFIVLARLFKGGDEVVECSEELITLCGGGILREQTAHAVKLQTEGRSVLV